jgi:hypothetical protein
MSRLQFSLRTLLLAFIPIGLAVAALANANYYWANAALNVTLACLGISLIASMWSRKRTRAFWSGFAVFGCGYMLLAFGPWFDSHIGKNLISQQVLERSASLFGHKIPFGLPLVMDSIWSNKDASWEMEYMKKQYPAATANNIWDYLFVGHCLFALLSGLLGGFIGICFYMRSEILISAKGGKESLN